MSLIDPIQLMTLMGTAPERSQRPRLLGYERQEGFERQMSAAMGKADGMAAVQAGGASAMENAFMHDAIQGLNSLMRKQGGSLNHSASAASTGRKIGALSATFESGSQGVSAIGYDKNGGTSYGTYQIASKPGTMKAFIEFLDTEAPEWAKELKAAGPANTGSKNGRMPDVWRKIAADNPEGFERLQRRFIESTHYEPARDKILARTGIDMDAMPAAAREALWSTAVQHGPAGAAKIFGRAIKALEGGKSGVEFAQKLISTIYDDRTTQFGSSTATVQASVKGRMNVEKEMVLAMLHGDDQAPA